jgi:hypothetical protein
MSLRQHRRRAKMALSPMAIRSGLYSIHIEMYDGAKGRASGIIILRDGRLIGGDNFFYYAGTYIEVSSGKWRGELVTHQHTVEIGVSFVFGGRDVGCGFTGTYAKDGTASVAGTALVGRTSVSFRADLSLLHEDED